MATNGAAIGVWSEELRWLEIGIRVRNPSFPWLCSALLSAKLGKNMSLGSFNWWAGWAHRPDLGLVQLVRPV